jgi:hypothetical protein
MIRFIYQYNGDPATRQYETVAAGTPPPNVGIYIWRKIGSQNLEWVVDNVTTTHETIAATANSPEQYQTDYIIDLGAAPASCNCRAQGSRTSAAQGSDACWEVS